MDFKNIQLSELIRYVLAGFIFILFVVILPSAYLKPNSVKDILSNSSFLALAVLSTTIGYLLDMLKAYQFTPNFRSKRESFFEKLAETLGVQKEYANNYFTLTTKLVRKHGFFDEDRTRAEWFLMLNTGLVMVLASFVWFTILFYQLFHHTPAMQLLVPGGAALLSILGARRLFKVADRERDKGNRSFLVLVENNKALILDSWKLVNTASDKPVIEEIRL